MVTGVRKMPQNNVLPDWKATYITDAKYQKPAGIPGTISRTATAGSWAANVATLTVPATTDYVGSVYSVTVAGFTPAGYNGTFQGTIASATTVTYPLGADPGGAATVFGTVSYRGTIPLVLSAVLPATAVPNKPQWTGTQIMEVGSEEWLAAMEQAKEGNGTPVAEINTQEDAEEEDMEEVEEEEDEPQPKGGGRRRR
jgi:hypothetical protein